jgi:hypothetical protein
MNFIQTLRDDQPLTPSPEYTLEHLKGAVEFFNELISLWVLEKVPSGSSLNANGSVVVLPKPGQTGQWQVISDMRSGGKNFYIANGPVYLPQVADLFPTLIPGGCTVSVDVSKELYHL